MKTILSELRECLWGSTPPWLRSSGMAARTQFHPLPLSKQWESFNPCLRVTISMTLRNSLRSFWMAFMRTSTELNKNPTWNWVTARTDRISKWPKNHGRVSPRETDLSSWIWCMDNTNLNFNVPLAVEYQLRLILTPWSVWESQAQRRNTWTSPS